MAENPKLFEQTTSSLSEGFSTDITLRDLLAGFALAGFAARWAVIESANENVPEQFRTAMAGAAYAAADAMLAERSK